MAERMPQTLSNHAKFDPPFHYIVMPALLANFVMCSVHAWRHQTPFTVWTAVMSVVLFLLAFLVRTYPLKAQDRVIRLEERMRLAALCPEPMRPRIHELDPRQLIALRFASDAELPALALRAMDEKLSEKQIKAAIQKWRADYCRI
jgi:hypothetical protein